MYQRNKIVEKNAKLIAIQESFNQINSTKSRHSINSISNSTGGIGSLKGTNVQLLQPTESLNQRQSNSMIARSVYKSKQAKIKEMKEKNKGRIHKLQMKHNI